MSERFEIELDPERACERIELGRGASVLWLPRFLTAACAKRLFDVLRAELEFEQGYVKMFGRRIAQPRLTAWYADSGCDYHYSGVTHPPSTWTSALVAIRAVLEWEFEATLNSVVANLYRDGSDTVGWHADDEPCFVDGAPIVSLSLGQARRFLLREREARDRVARDRREFVLESGSALAMLGEAQHSHEHSVPRTKKRVAERINLTWRCYRAR